MASFGKINNFDSLYLSDSDDEETKHQKSIAPCLYEEDIPDSYDCETGKPVEPGKEEQGEYGDFQMLGNFLSDAIIALKDKGSKLSEWSDRKIPICASEIYKIEHVLDLLKKKKFSFGISAKDLSMKKIQEQKFKDDENSNLGDLMQYFLDSLLDEFKKVQLDEFQPVRNLNFAQLLPKNMQKFFTNIVDHHQGSYQGEIISLSSWYIGKRNVIPKVFITSFEGYGSCSMCDHLQWVEDVLYECNSFISDIDHEKTKDAYYDWQGVFDGHKDFIKFEIERFMKSFIENEIYGVFKGLQFHKTFNGARKTVLEQYNYWGDKDSPLVFKKSEKKESKGMVLKKSFNEEFPSL